MSITVTPRYAELHCVSNFTFLRGASHPEELIARAARLGYDALALTDECSLAGVVRAHVKARSLSEESPPKLIIGSELVIQLARPAASSLKFVSLASNRDGYGRLSALITKARRVAEKGHYRLAAADLAKVEQLRECFLLYVPEPSLPDEVLAQQADWMRSCFGDRAWIAAELFCGGGDAAWLTRLHQLAASSGLPLVAAGNVHMHARSRRALQDVLSAVRLRCPVADVGFALFANGERHLRSRQALTSFYPKALLAETLHIAAQCDFSLDELRYEYPQEVVPPKFTPQTYLRHVTYQGMRTRWPDGPPPQVCQMVERELDLIEKLGYEPYFLTVYDLVRFARSQGILCQGRGSAANSTVCYCLRITEVDPARMATLFERFISKERNEPPDIDVDFEHERREEVIQYIYRKYGRTRAALAATVVSYRPRSAIRDVGKALGLSLDQVDRLAKSLAWWDGHQVVPSRLRDAGLDPDSSVASQLAILVDSLVGFPRHLSQHVGGFVMSRGPLERLVPIENAAMEARTVIQWDKDDLESLGLLKVDVLALGMLSAIRRGLDLISVFRGQRWTMADIPAEDPEVYRMLGKADTVGVFQIESRAQMAMLPRLRPRTFYDLVIEVAIVRPGPIQGGMVHPYLRRRQGLEPVTYPSAAVQAVLERTLGIPIFQEQVMQLAVVAAGFTPGEADGLRRAMAAWRRKGGLAPFEQRLSNGMRERGYSEAFARQIFKQIQGFGEYGFPESHSASLALLVYVSSWLKCHEPAAFTCALLNSQPMGFYAPSQLIQDARRHGVEVRPVDVCYSHWDSSLERDTQGGPVLRLGLRLIKGLREEDAFRIVAAQGKATTVPELARTTHLSRAVLERLAQAGALKSIAGHRYRAQWAVLGVETLPPMLAGAGFAEPRLERLPALTPPSEGQNIVADYAALGLSLERHPLALLRARFHDQRFARAAELRETPHGDFVRAIGLVVGRQRPSTASGVIFMTLEDETGFVNVVIWPWVVERQRREVLASRLVEVTGIVEREREVVHLIAGRLRDCTVMLGGLDARSRDFH